MGEIKHGTNDNVCYQSAKKTLLTAQFFMATSSGTRSAIFLTLPSYAQLSFRYFFLPFPNEISYF